MRRIGNGVLVCGLFFLAAGCTPKPSGGTPTAILTHTAALPGANPPAAFESMPAAPSPVQEEKPAAPPTPATLQQALAVIDLRNFPAMEGATRIDTSPVGAHFTLPKGEIAKAVDFYRTTLTGLGWQEATEPEARVINEHGAMLLFRKQGFQLYAAIGISPADKNLNAGLFHAGNIDIRQLPRPNDAELTHPFPTNTVYRTGLDAKAAKEFLRTELKKQGWLEYSRPRPPGIPAPTGESTFQELLLFQQAVTLEYFFQVQQGKTQVIARVGLMPLQLPILPDARVIEYQPDPLVLAYATPAEPEQILQFYRKGLTELGWKESTGAGKVEKQTAALKFEKPEQEPLRFEFLQSDQISIVRLTRWPKNAK